MNKDINIIFKDQEGHEIRKSDLKSATGKVQYELIGNQHVSPQASQLHQQSRHEGQQGNYLAALELLEQAHKLAPEWPYPVYDMAYTYLLQEDINNAVKYYTLVNQLAPGGFFTTKTALHTLKKEVNGNYPKGLYLAYLRIEWTNSIAQKEKIARNLIERVPDFAPAWKELANCLEESPQKLVAIEQGLQANPDLETKGMLLINKAIVLFNQGKHQEAIDILGYLIVDTENTIGTRESAKFVLSQFID
jgi:tetratricopeptide (TPR) repeat protein